MPFERAAEAGGRVFGNAIGGVIKRNDCIILNAGILKIALRRMRHIKRYGGQSAGNGLVPEVLVRHTLFDAISVYSPAPAD